MNAFERFSIRHLSPSSLNLWQSSPGLWTLRYLGRMKDEVGAAVWRGQAVEAGMTHWLFKKDREGAELKALTEFDQLALGLADDDVQGERDNILPMLDTAIIHCAKMPAPLMAAQVKVEHWLDEIPIPVIGFIDWLLENGAPWELKTTMACPSKPRPEHARQGAFYSEVKQQPATILYATPKRAADFPITDNERSMYMSQLRRSAVSLARFLDRCETPADAILALPPNPDDFKWSEAASNFISELEQDNAASHREGHLRQSA